MSGGGVCGKDIPVAKCRLSDKAGLLSAVQKMVPIFTSGMPQFGVEVLDPMKMYDMDYDLSGLQFSLAGGTYEGLKNAVVDDFNWDIEKKEFTVEFRTDTKVTGPYTAAGHVAHLPISGNGHMILNMKNLYVKITIPFDIEKKGNKDYVRPTKYSFEFDVKEHADFNLSNLFDGDKAKSDEMSNFLNENWKKITDDFGTPLIDIAARKIKENISRFFDKKSINEIAIV